MPVRRPETSAWGRWLGLVVTVGVFDARDGSSLVRDHPGGRGVCPVAELPQHSLVVVCSETTNPTNLAAQVRLGDRPIAEGPLARALRASGDWRLVSERLAVTHITARIDLFERSRTPPQDAPEIARGSPRLDGVDRHPF